MQNTKAPSRKPFRPQIFLFLIAGLVQLGFAEGRTQQQDAQIVRKLCARTADAGGDFFALPFP